MTINTHPELPPMPEPAFRLRWHSVGARYTVSKPNIGDTNVFTETEMRTYALLCRNAALEEAAKACENSHPPLKREGGRVEIGERARNAFADAIRNLKEHGNDR